MNNDFNFFKVFNENAGLKKVIKLLNLENVLMPIVLFILIVTTIFFDISLRNRNEKIEESIKAIEAEIDEIRKTGEVDEIDAIRTARDEMFKVSSILNTLSGKGYQVTYKHLLGINNSLPLGVFLESIEILDPEDGGSSNVSGYSQDNTLVANFQNNLESNDNFDNTYVKDIIFEEDKGFGFILYLDLERGE